VCVFQYQQMVYGLCMFSFMCVLGNLGSCVFFVDHEAFTSEGSVMFCGYSFCFRCYPSLPTSMGKPTMVVVAVQGPPDV